VNADSATVEGDVVRVTYDNPSTGFRVLRVGIRGRREPVTVIGVFPATPAGSHVRATGRFESNAKHGEQFRAETLITVAPETLDGLVLFLGSGMIPGVGPAFAQRIVDTFGMQTLEVLDQAPERLREVSGLGAKRAKSVRESWKEHRAIAAIMVFLQSHGASPALATRIYKHFGSKAIELVSRNPYRLALDVSGIGFKTADRIAQTVGIAKDAPERAQAGVLHTLHEVVGRGHVYAPRADLTEAAAAMLEVDVMLADEALCVLESAQRVRLDELDDDRGGVGQAVYPRELFEAEVHVAERLHTLVEMTPPRAAQKALDDSLGAAVASFEQSAGVELASAQREAVELCAKHKVVVITGGPGVGKTTIVRAVLALLQRAKLEVRLAAPTGRAAKRMTETTGREATTVHRLLEFDPRSRTFTREADRPLVCDALIVDEASMVDLPMARALLDALKNDARLILVGDVDQLPSVGPGAILRDIIQSGLVPTARLTQIFRQAEGSQIVENAHRIRAGEAPHGEDGKNGEFYVIERQGGDAAADAILELVTRRMPKRFGLSPTRDIQVLTPMHGGPAGAIALNERLQSALNPDGPSATRGAKTLRVGDKVMQLRNDYDREVYNGDIGFIERVSEEDRKVTVLFEGREVVYEERGLDDLTLAYATTIHKSQGSEYPAVVVPILTGHFVMLSRNLVYTAVTRGKRLVVMVADPRAVGLALAETRKELRATRLSHRLSD